MIAGLILLYFVDAAFKIQIMNWEMLIHSALRFFTGFILIGIGVFYAHKIRFKSAVYLVLALVLADDIWIISETLTALALKSCCMVFICCYGVL